MSEISSVSGGAAAASIYSTQAAEPSGEKQTLSLSEVRALIEKAVADALANGAAGLTQSAGMPRFVLNEIKQLLEDFKNKTGVFAEPVLPGSPSHGSSGIDVQIGGGVSVHLDEGESIKLPGSDFGSTTTVTAGPNGTSSVTTTLPYHAELFSAHPEPAKQVAATTASAPTTTALVAPSVVYVPTTPHLTAQGEVLAAVSPATASLYNVQPGVITPGATLSPASTSASTTPTQTQPAATVSKEVATSYAQGASNAVSDSLRQLNQTAQTMAEGSGGGDDSAVAKKKVGGTQTAKSWLMAIAEALGSALGMKAQQMLISTNEIANLTKSGSDISQSLTNTNLTDAEKANFNNLQQDNAHKFTLETSRLQGASQEFNMLQNAMSNTIKSLGESLAQLARKG